MITISDPPLPPIASMEVPAGGDAPASRHQRSRRRSIVWAILKKEVHENSGAAGLLWAGLLVVAIFFAANYTAVFTRPATRMFIVMDEAVLNLSCVYCAAAGFLLGFVPHRTTRAFDAWAFLVHRPLTRARLFWCRAAVGMAMYAVVVLVPVAVWLAWAWGYKRLMPVFPCQFFLPYLADAGLGIVAFLAGHVVGQRRASWVLTGLLPVLAVVAVVAAVMQFQFFWQVMVVEAIAGAILTLVAHESAVTHGEHTRRGLVWRGALLAVLCAGIVLPALVIREMSGQWYEMEWHEESSAFYAALDARAQYSYSLVMLHDGRVGIWRQGPDRNGNHAEVRDLNGNRVEGTEVLAWGMSRIGDTGMFQLNLRYRDLSSIVKRLDGGKLGLLNYAEDKPRLEWLYLIYARLVIGVLPDGQVASSLGPSGVHEGWSAEPFPDPSPEDPTFNRHDYYDVGLSLDRKSVQVTHLAFPGEQLLYVENHGAQGIVGTDQHLYVYNGNGARLTLPLKRSSRVLFAPVFEGEGYVLQSYPRKIDDSTIFEWYDKEGRLLKTATMPWVTTARWYVWRDYGSPAYSGWLRFVAATAGAMKSALPVGIVPWGRSDLYGWGYVEGPRYYLAGLGIAQLAGFWAMLRLCRHYFVKGWPRLGWLAGALVIGPSALVLFGGTRHRPPSIRCHRCGKRQPASEFRCRLCGGAVQAPARNGTEIFGSAKSLVGE